MESLTLPRAAVIVVLPAATPVASPPLVIVATFVALDVQVTALVMGRVVLSENVPSAVNCCVALMPMLGLVGVIAMDTSAG
jgi:hypothetical protein